MGLRLRLALALLVAAIAPLALALWLVQPLLESARAQMVRDEQERARLVVEAATDERPLLLATRAFCEQLSGLDEADWRLMLTSKKGPLTRRRLRKLAGRVQALAARAGLAQFAVVAAPGRTVFSIPEGAAWLPGDITPSAAGRAPLWRYLADESRLSLTWISRCQGPPGSPGPVLLAGGREWPLPSLAENLSAATGLGIHATGRLPGQAAAPAGGETLLRELPGAAGQPVALITADLSKVGAALLAQTRRRLLGVGLAAVALAAILALLLADRLARPLRRLAGAVERVADEPFHPSPMPAAGGEAGVLGRSVDRMLAALAREHRGRLRAERAAVWQQVARRLAHEIRNPLTPMRLAVENLQRAARKGPGPLEASLEEEASAILEEISRLERLVREFSEFARLPAPRPRRVELSPLLRRAVEGQYGEGAHDDKAEEGEARWEVRFDERFDGALEADPDLFVMALANLARNAREAMTEGGTLKVSVFPEEAPPDPRRLVILFEDSGPGIPEELLSSVFEPYVTGRGGQGTGLGLAVVRQIVLQHGGTIEARNRPEAGAAFEIRWPLPDPSGAGPVPPPQEGES